MRKLIKKIKMQFIWFFDGRVLDAINNGAPYEKVMQLVESIADGNLGGNEL